MALPADRTTVPYKVKLTHYVRDRKWNRSSRNTCFGRMRRRGWLRHCATIQRAAGSIPYGSLEIFHWLIPWLHNRLGVDSAFDRNEYQEYFLGGKGGRYVGLTNLPHSCDECLKVWEPQVPGTLRACRGLWWDCFTFYEAVQGNGGVAPNILVIPRPLYHHVRCNQRIWREDHLSII
jgi:hypothetical protein